MPKKEPFTKKDERNCKYKFNDAELLAIGKSLAESNEKLSALEDEKKRVTSDFAARIAGVEADVSIAVNEIRSGYEWRKMPVTVYFDKPKEGRKTFVRDDTNEVVGEEAMDANDRQAVMDFEQDPAS